MKITKILGIALLVSTTSASAFAGGNPIPTDKAAHYGLGFATQMTCAAVAKKITGEKLWSNVGCFAVLNAVGVAKELTDRSRGDNPDVLDAAANVAGTGSAFLVFQFGF